MAMYGSIAIGTGERESTIKVLSCLHCAESKFKVIDGIVYANGYKEARTRGCELEGNVDKRCSTKTFSHCRIICILRGIRIQNSTLLYVKIFPHIVMIRAVRNTFPNPNIL